MSYFLMNIMYQRFYEVKQILPYAAVFTVSPAR